MSNRKVITLDHGLTPEHELQSRASVHVCRTIYVGDAYEVLLPVWLSLSKIPRESELFQFLVEHKYHHIEFLRNPAFTYDELEAISQYFEFGDPMFYELGHYTLDEGAAMLDEYYKHGAYHTMAYIFEHNKKLSPRRLLDFDWATNRKLRSEFLMYKGLANDLDVFKLAWQDKPERTFLVFNVGCSKTVPADVVAFVEERYHAGELSNDAKAGVARIELLKSETYEALSQEKYRPVILNLARNPSTPVAILYELSTAYKTPNVRINLASNTATPLELLSEMYYSTKSKAIREAIEKNRKWKPIA